MISFMNTIKMTDRSVVATCLLGFELPGTGVSAGASEARLSERPIQAPAVAATAQAIAYAFAANGAGSRKTQQQHHQKWALRGLGPWSYPA
ncbi:hypothetical protein ACWDSL_48135 [Streptomyces sp. NPDC000941]